MSITAEQIGAIARLHGHDIAAEGKHGSRLVLRELMRSNFLGEQQLIAYGDTGLNFHRIMQLHVLEKYPKVIPEEEVMEVLDTIQFFASMVQESGMNLPATKVIEYIQGCLKTS